MKDKIETYYRRMVLAMPSERCVVTPDTGRSRITWKKKIRDKKSQRHQFEISRKTNK